MRCNNFIKEIEYPTGEVESFHSEIGEKTFDVDFPLCVSSNHTTDADASRLDFSLSERAVAFGTKGG